MTAHETRGDQGRPAAGPAGRTGIFFCRCGPNVGQVVRLDALGDPAAWPAVHDVATHPVLCSAEGKAWLAERLRAGRLERVVIAACSPREHELTFRAVLQAEGRSPFHLQMVNLREQVEWVGGDPDAATEQAHRLVRGALARLALHRPLPMEEVDVCADVLVVGAGPAGLTAALALAGRGRRVVMAEQAFVVGGLANRLDEVFPRLECASCFMEPVLDRVLHHERIEVLTGAEVRRVRGAAGGFEVEIALRPRGVDPAACLGCGECEKACPAEQAADPFAAGLAPRKAIGLPYAGCLPHVSVLDAATCVRARGIACDRCVAACPFAAIRLDEPPAARTVKVGAIVVATGLAPGEVTGPDGLVSSYQLERMLHPDGPTRGTLRGRGGQAPRAVLLASDADDDGDLASLEILKLAHVVKARLPSARVSVAGDLARVPHLRRRAAELSAEGIELLPARFAPRDVTAAGERLVVRLAGAVDDVREADLVVVHAAARPSAGSDALARLLGIAKGDRGFLLDHGASPFEPTATRKAGIYVAGAAAGPRPIAHAIRDGAAAAGLVHASLVPGERRLVEPLCAEVDEALCGGCGICASACPSGAIRLGGRDEAAPPEPPLAPGQPHPAAPTLAARRKARVDAVHCRGCGTCAAACPTGAASARHFTRAQIEAEIAGLLAPGQPHPAAPALASHVGDRES